jgi:trehalose synthase-fused probable maltokinase
MSTTPVIEATAATALANDTLKKLEGAPLAHFLSRQRWFSSKHDSASAVFIEIVPLFPSCDAVLAQVDVRELQGSAIASYLLPMALTESPSSEQQVIALLKTGSTTLAIVDGAHDARFRESLIRYIADERTFASPDGTQVRFHRHGDLEVDTAAVKSKVASVQQSNTSILYGDKVIVKLFRKLSAGENPDIEIGAYLTEKGAKVTPALLGSAQLDGDRGPTALVMAQRLVPSARDCWEYVCERLRGLNVSEEPFIDDAVNLGRVTRELHEALAAATDKHAFTPARGTRDDLVRWCTAIRHEISDTTALLKRTDLSKLPREAIVAQGVKDITEQPDAVLRDVTILEAASDLDIGLTIRHHGDYHLGQVLRDNSGRFYIIDFEGEPARPLAERRALHSALRDVAGMLRSFAYASSMAALNQGNVASPIDWDAALFRAETWQKHARDAFMQGYLSIASPLLPADVATIERLVRLFALEKAFYELRYELAHRPDWVWVPMRGISEIVRDSIRTGRRPSGGAQPSPA